ncbi:SDR family NAD(P)-dependent oxidoreductase [Streptomyces sp. NPDC026672]|uniref:SDR family NAD(P)-dependent oxidoreductase n=1 Tax=unclassified Streptomyces TaxID=2593676 RepID=UPI0033D8A850
MTVEPSPEPTRPLHQILSDHARHRTDEPAFQDSRRSVTYGALERRTRFLAGHLAALGVDRGDRVLLRMDNRVEMVEGYLAVTRAGAVGVPVDRRSSDAELAHHLTDSGARLVISSAAQVPQVVRTAEAAGLECGVIAVGATEPVAQAADFEHLAVTPPPVGARDDLGLDEPAWILYTSGTTGRPKGVVSTQRRSLWATSACTAPILGLSPDDRMVWPMPLYHAVSHNIGVLATLSVGSFAHILEGADPDDIADAVRSERATFLVSAPTTYHRMVDMVREQGIALPSMRVCMAAGSACPPALHEAFEATFGIRLLDSYGSSETGGAITTQAPTGPRVLGSCGHPLPGLALRLANPRTGEEVPAGDEGEIWVDSPGTMLGYHNDPEATGSVLVDGWYRTGDLGRQDASGQLTITGRVKELIIRGGENIHPGEVERVLARVPGVAEAAVAGRPHAVLGEVPVAYLVPGPEGADGIDPQQLLEVCRRELSYFKVPEEFHAVESVPRTSTGKIARRLLADLPGTLLAVNPSAQAAAEPADALATPGGPGASGLGVVAVAHGLLGSAVEVPGTGTVVFTGRVSADTHPWLTDELPGGTERELGWLAAELALAAGEELGSGRLRSLTTEAPFVPSPAEGAQLRVTVGAGEETGVRTVSVHSRRGDEVLGLPWTCHATGELVAAAELPDWDLEAWPPADAVPVPEAEWQGERTAPASVVRGVWRHGAEVFAEVALPDAQADDALRYGLHPVLAEALLGVTGSQGVLPGTAASWRVRDWQGVSLHAFGACVLRARVVPGPDGDGTVSWAAADATGTPVLSAPALRFEPAARGVLRSAAVAQQDSLFGIEWSDVDTRSAAADSDTTWALLGDDVARTRSSLMSAGRYTEVYADLAELTAAVEGGHRVPDVVVVPFPGSGAEPSGQDLTDAVHATTVRALETARAWVTTPAYEGSRLVFLTQRAVPGADGPGGTAPLDLRAAGVWGLIRSAQSEYPGCFTLVDTDGAKPTWRTLNRVAALAEPQWALRGRTARVPRLVRVAPAAELPVLDAGPDRTVLVTGGTGAPGSALARHLVAEHGVRDLLLTSRQGQDAPGAAALEAELAALGARVRIAACDVTDLKALTALLAGERIGAVVHAAGTTDDGILPSLTAERLSGVLRPKVDAAVNLYEAVREAGVGQFVLYSSLAGVLGTPAQANHAAAGTFLDAFAHHLASRGVPATSIAWGPWAAAGNPSGGTATDRRPRTPGRTRPLAPEQSPGLFDAAWAADRSLLVAGRLDLAGLNDDARAGSVPAVLRALVSAPARRTARNTPAQKHDLRHRLAAMSRPERETAVVDLVCEKAGGVLGRTTPGGVPADALLKDLGFDSLTGLHLRTALAEATGLRLSAGLVFDFDTPVDMARYLIGQLLDSGPAEADAE